MIYSVIIIYIYRTVHDNAVSEIQTVELRQGGSANLQVVGVVGSNLPVSGATGQWQWNIPVDTKTDASCMYIMNYYESKRGSDCIKKNSLVVDEIMVLIICC